MAAKKEPSKRRGKVVKNGDGAAAFEAGEAAPPKVFDAEVVAVEMDAWFNAARNSFIVRLPDGRWHQRDQQSLIDAMRALPGRMIAIKARDGEMLSEAKMVLNHIRNHRAVDGVLGALPGYFEGVHLLDSQEQVLIRTSPVLIDGVEGEWPTIQRICDGLFGPCDCDEIDQRPWWWSACKCWYESFARPARERESGTWRQNHAVILTGPPGCGKNLVQEEILTALIGGRFVDPLKFLQNEDEFNGDVVSAEHWLLSEIPSSQRTEDRVAFSERIKQLVANKILRMRLMRAEPSTIRPFIRLSISVNDDADTLRSLPIVSSGYGDKILIFHCHAKPLPFVSEANGLDQLERRKALQAAIRAELPAFIHWLEHVWEIPAELLESRNGDDPTRFGFREFHHPVIRAELFEDTPAAQMLRYIDLAEFRHSPMDAPMKLWELQAPHNHEPMVGRWWGRAESLQQLLTGESELMCSIEVMAKKFFQHNKVTTLLGRLKADEITGGMMGRVYKGRETDTRAWKGWWIGAPTSA